MTEMADVKSPLRDFVHRFIPGKSGRTLLLLHGTGGDEESLVPLASRIDGQASILSVRGRVLENDMPRFFRRFAEGVFDIQDLKFRANELGDFLLRASKEYRFSLDSLIAVGYSNGANMGAALLLLRPDVLGGAILLRPTLPLVPENVPKLSGRRVFISAGFHDRFTPREGTERLERLLREAGADVTVNWEQEGHSLTQAEPDKANTWLGR
jgi:phospholipase/carboxylesterase